MCWTIEHVVLTFWLIFQGALGSAALSNFGPAKDHTDVWRVFGDGSMLNVNGIMAMRPQHFPLDVSRHVVFQVGNLLQFIQIYRWLYTSNNYAVSDCIAALFNPQYIQLYPQCIISKLYPTIFHDRTDIDIASGAQPSMPSGHRCTWGPGWNVLERWRCPIPLGIQHMSILVGEEPWNELLKNGCVAKTK